MLFNVIPKIPSLKNFQCSSCKISRKQNLKQRHKIKVKRESTKDLLDQSHNFSPKPVEIQRIRVIYKPINPQNKFNSSSFGINEMMKKDNISLITNDKIRNLIVKFRAEREKEISEKKIFYKEKSYQDLQKEKNTNFLMLRAMLRRDPLTIQVLMRKNRDLEKKLNKCSSTKIYLKKFNKNKSTILSKDNYLSEKYNNNSSSINNISSGSFTQKKNIIPKKEIWNKDILAKIEKIKRAFLKKFEAKITNVGHLTISGHLFIAKNPQFAKKKFNQDCSFTYYNFMSAKLGDISLFGIFDGNGSCGKAVALGFKNYIINYFKTGNEMRVTLKKDNFYSIMYNSFVNAQNYLINNSTKLNINLKYSGATGIVLLFPHNNSNKVYCANVGRNRCMFYTNYGSIRLSYELFPHRASERFRISRFLSQKITKESEKKEEMNANINNNNIKKNSFDDQFQNNEEENKVVYDRERDNFLKEFYELDISRCIGNLAAEEYGVIPGPEIIESDLRLNKGKFIVMGTESLWRYITEDEVGEIVNKHFSSTNSDAACKELQELAKERWKSDVGGYDDISVIVIFIDSKNI